MQPPIKSTGRGAKADDMAKKDLAFGVILGLVLLLEVAGSAERMGYLRNLGSVSAERAVGRDLDRQFVEALITRYKDTLSLAERERLNGHNPELRKLADALVEARRLDLNSLMRFAVTDGADIPVAKAR